MDMIPGQRPSPSRSAEQARARAAAVGNTITDPTAAPPDPNTGPDKVKGVFAYNDEIYIAGQWSRLYYWLREGDTDGVSVIIRDCGCGGPKQVPTSALVHKWHHQHGDATP